MRRASFFLILSLVIFLQYAGIALAQEIPAPEANCTSFFCGLLANFPELNAWLIATFTFIGLILRATADFLAFVGQRIANKSTSDWAKKVNSWAIWAAQIIGWFGGGTPKAVLEKKVENERAKEKPE